MGDGDPRFVVPAEAETFAEELDGLIELAMKAGFSAEHIAVALRDRADAWERKANEDEAGR